jgi:hypothetical protein
MSTNATVDIFNEKGEHLIKIYKHWDGDTFYETLVEFLSNIKVENGVSDYNALFKKANTAGCLTAQLVKYIKETVGDVYIQPVDFPNERWHYNIVVKKSHIAGEYDMHMTQYHEGNFIQIWKFNYRD